MISILYRCDLMSPSGYSRAARNHIRALIEAGVSVSAMDKKKDPTTVEPDKFWRRNLPKVVTPSNEKPDVMIWHETPDYFNPESDVYNIGYVPWETSKINMLALNGNPRTNWAAQMNKMDEMWTSAESCKQAFIDSGVTVPIYVFPHPIDLEAYSPGDKGELQDERGKIISTNMFSMLSVFQWNARKNPLDLLVYYLTNFNGREDVILNVKTYKVKFGDQQDINFVRNRMRVVKKELLLPKPPRLQAIWAHVPEVEIPDLYRSCDVYMGLPMGEGFGLPFQEAMACSVPCVFPRSSSMLDFMDDEVGYGVDVTAEPVTATHMPDCPLTPWYQASQLWWRPTYISAKNAMNQAYLDWKSGKLKDKGKKARERIEQLHSFKKIGADMKARLEEVLK